MNGCFYVFGGFGMMDTRWKAVFEKGVDIHGPSL